MGKSSINGHFQKLLVYQRVIAQPPGNKPNKPHKFISCGQMGFDWNMLYLTIQWFRTSFSSRHCHFKQTPMCRHIVQTPIETQTSSASPNFRTAISLHLALVSAGIGRPTKPERSWNPCIRCRKNYETMIVTPKYRFPATVPSHRFWHQMFAYIFVG
jgi:hypothetical protein